MTTQLLESNCDGGHYTCTPPKECCKQGCCYIFIPSSYSKPSLGQSINSFNPLFLGHWYFWLAITATLTGILCACSLWRKHTQGTLCTRSRRREDRLSELDSNDSCYVPPHYSRCNSFYQTPPPYSEVTSKPDRYPIVITYDLEPSKKSNSSSGFLMVQYFRKLIVRPVGTTLSTASTFDSLSSNFICSVAIEANSVVPPPYSSAASLEQVVVGNKEQCTSDSDNISPTTASNCSTVTIDKPSHQKSSQILSYLQENVYFEKNTTKNNNPLDEENSTKAELLYKKNQTSCDPLPAQKGASSSRNLSKGQSTDSEGPDESHNFSDILNPSVCVPSNSAFLKLPVHSNSLLQELNFSLTNSITGSDISSIANMDTAESPPRAPSPTIQMKELLTKIQKMPQPNRSNSSLAQEYRPSRNHFHKIKSKTLYMPLLENQYFKNNKHLPNVSSKCWLSRSAPNTPSSNFIPSFPITNKSKDLNRLKPEDNKSLLTENSDSDDI